MATQLYICLNCKNHLTVTDGLDPFMRIKCIHCGGQTWHEIPNQKDENEIFEEGFIKYSLLDENGKEV